MNVQKRDDGTVKLSQPHPNDQMINDLRYDDGNGTMIDILPMPRNNILLAKAFLLEAPFNVCEPIEILKLSAKD